VRWQDTLALFNVDIQHKPRKDNVVLDVLSWKHQLKVVYVRETKLQKEFLLTSCRDEFSKETKEKIQKGIKSHFHLQNWLLWYKQNWLYGKGNLRMCSWRSVMMGPLRAMVVQNAHNILQKNLLLA
jgi:hypothetical protein